MTGPRPERDDLYRRAVDAAFADDQQQDPYAAAVDAAFAAPLEEPAAPTATLTEIASAAATPERPDVTAQRNAPPPTPIEEAGPIRRGAATSWAFTTEALGEAMRSAARAIRKPSRRTAAKLGLPETGEREERVAKWLEQQGEEFATGARERAAEIPGPKRPADWENLGDAIDWAAFSVSQGVVSSLPSLVGGATGGLVAGPPGAFVGALGPGYLLNQEEVRRALKDEGISDERADQISEIAAIPMAALDVVVPARLGTQLTQPLKQSLTRAVVRGFLREAATSGVLEGLTEAGQSAIQQGTAATAAGRRLTGEDVAQILEEGAAGGLTGAVLGTGGHAVQAGREIAGAERVGEAAKTPTPAPTDAYGAAVEAAFGEEGTPEAPKRSIRQRIADVIDPERAQRVEQLEVERRSAQREAETDELTGLGNKRAFERAAGQHVRGSNAARLPIRPQHGDTGQVKFARFA